LKFYLFHTQNTGVIYQDITIKRYTNTEPTNHGLKPKLNIAYLYTENNVRKKYIIPSEESAYQSAKKQLKHPINNLLIYEINTTTHI